MADEILGVAQIEIVATLDGLSADLEAARNAVSDSMGAIGDSVSETGNLFGSMFDTAASRMLDSIAEADQARSVWLSLGDAALGLADDIAQVVLQLTVLNPLLNALSGGDGLPALDAGSAGGFLSGIPQLMGFASGADFDVGGSGGIDSQLVAFRATPGERVNVTPANDRGTAGAVTNVQVHNYSGSNASVEQRTNAQGGKDVTVYIGEAMARDVRLNGPLGQAMRQNYGASPVPIQR